MVGWRGGMAQDHRSCMHPHHQLHGYAHTSLMVLRSMHAATSITEYFIILLSIFIIFHGKLWKVRKVKCSGPKTFQIINMRTHLLKLSARAKSFLGVFRDFAYLKEHWLSAGKCSLCSLRIRNIGYHSGIPASTMQLQDAASWMQLQDAVAGCSCSRQLQEAGTACAIAACRCSMCNCSVYGVQLQRAGKARNCGAFLQHASAACRSSMQLQQADIVCNCNVQLQHAIAKGSCKR